MDGEASNLMGSALAAPLAKTNVNDDHLLDTVEHIARSIGRMLPGLCEVVVHDLRTPANSIRLIENNLSGRQVGDGATELGLRRINDPAFPDVVQNYANSFPDGRPAKSTSIGIRNAAGRYIGALCLNLDISVLSPLTYTLANLVAIGVEHREHPLESLSRRAGDALREAVERYASERGLAPRALPREAKRELVRELRREGFFETRGAGSTIAGLLGLSRATVYAYSRDEQS